MIEWYDFYIFGSLASVISPLFYPTGNDTLALIAYLSTFAVGFVVRPFGALFFGRIGDLVGRKYAFLVTLIIMGGRDRADRRAADLRVDRDGRAGGAAPDPRAAGAGARRRIRRRGGLRRRARAGRAAGLLYQLHPDHRDARPVRLAGGHPDRAEHDVAGGVPRVGLARPVPDLDPAGGGLAVHPAADEGVADFSAHQGHRRDLDEAAARGVHAVGEPEAGAHLAVRRDGRARAWSGTPASSTRCSTCRPS